MDIREILKKKEIKIPELAVLTGIPQDRIYKWIYNDIEPHPYDQQAIDDWYNLIKDVPKEDIKMAAKKARTILKEEGQITPKIRSLILGNITQGKKLPSLTKEIIPLGKNVSFINRDYAKSFEDWDGIPMYNAPITASFIETYRDDVNYTPQYYLHDPRFKDCSFGAIITGDSMHSEIRHGDYVICQEITDRRFIVYGDIYYIVAQNGLETCKYINADKENKDNFLLVPRNEAISPSPIPKDMISKLYKVKGILRGY